MDAPLSICLMLTNRSGLSFALSQLMLVRRFMSCCSSNSSTRLASRTNSDIDFGARCACVRIDATSVAAAILFASGGLQAWRSKKGWLPDAFPSNLSLRLTNSPLL